MAVKSKKWFDPQTETGWRKGQAQSTRLARLRKAHGGDLLAAARGINALANVTQDAATKKLARADAKKLFKLYKMKTAKAIANPKGGNPMAKRKLVIPAIMRRFGGHTYYEYIANVAKKTAESEARKAKGAGLLTRVVPTGSKWTVYTRAPENPSKKRQAAKAAGIATPTVLAVLFIAGLVYLAKKNPEV